MTPVARSVWRLLLRGVAIALFVLVIVSFGPLIWHLFSPFLLAIPVALMLQRPIAWMERRLHVKHGLAVAVCVVLVCGVICVLLYWLLAAVVGQIVQLSGNYQTIISDLVSFLRGVFNQVLDALDYLPGAAEEWMRGALNDGLAYLSTTATRWITLLINFVINFAGSIPYALIYLNFLILAIFFITTGYRNLRERGMSLLGESARNRSEMLSGTAGQGLAGYVKVQLFYGLLVLVISIPCLSLFGIPYAVLIAALAALLEFLPIFGNGTLYVPWAIICYIIGMPTLGTEMLILHLVLFIFRRLTEPKLMSNQMGLSTLLSLVAMFAGMQLGGVLGLILAPVLAVVFLSAWHGGLFAATVLDIRTVFQYVSGLLREPTEDTPSQPPPVAKPAAVSQPGPKRKRHGKR